MKTPLHLLLPVLLGCALPLVAQTPKRAPMEFGSLISYSVTGKGGDIALKGVSIRLDAGTNQAAICFDTDLMRYTGQPVHAPLALHVKKNGVEISFTTLLDAASANHPQSYSVEQWNYL